MTRRILLLGALIAMLCGASAAASARTPVFAALLPGASRPPDSGGFGQAKPSRISFGGVDVLCHIHWVSWGGQFAIGTGTGFTLNRTTYKRRPAPAVVVLSDLGNWHGRRAYRKYTLDFPPTGKPHGGVKRCSA